MVNRLVAQAGSKGVIALIAYKPKVKHKKFIINEQLDLI
jgi:hypothetical protein